jgi:hypothetical protein
MLEGGGVLIDTVNTSTWEYIFTCGCGMDMITVITLNKDSRTLRHIVKHRDNEYEGSMLDSSFDTKVLLHKLSYVAKENVECSLPWEG